MCEECKPSACDTCHGCTDCMYHCKDCGICDDDENDEEVTVCGACEKCSDCHGQCSECNDCVVELRVGMDNETLFCAECYVKHTRYWIMMYVHKHFGIPLKGITEKIGRYL